MVAAIANPISLVRPPDADQQTQWLASTWRYWFLTRMIEIVDEYIANQEVGFTEDYFETIRDSIQQQRATRRSRATKE